MSDWSPWSGITGHRAVIGNGIELLRAPLARTGNVVIPKCYLPRRIKAGIDSDHRRRPERVVVEFLLAIGHHLHGFAHGFGEAGGVECLQVACFPDDTAADKRDNNCLLYTSPSPRD